MFHLFGNILTSYGTAANNRGENQGNITTLQKIIWKGETHTTVSSEAIRWALRYFWQKSGYQVNRKWEKDAQPEPDHFLQDSNFDDVRFIDDDVLGFLKLEGPTKEASENYESENTLNSQDTETKDSTEGEVKSDSQTEGNNTLNAKKKKAKKKSKEKPKGKITTRRGVLEVTRAVSTIPYTGDITLNAVSGKKGSTSLYGTEVHATRYQYGFALTPDFLKDKSRINAVLDGLISIGEVAGNHARFFYDFSPESIILRWTHDFSPRFLYCFEEDEFRNISVPDLIQRVKDGDIEPEELWIGGKISRDLEDLKALKANVFPGVKKAVAELKKAIAKDLQ